MQKDIIYRPATLKDARKLSILFKQVYIHTYGKDGVSDEFANFITEQFSVARLEHIISENVNPVIVADNNTNLVGVVEIHFNKKCPINDIIAPELNKLYILDWFCGKGIGTRLLEEAENLVKANGITEMWLWVLDTNEQAISFYEKHGYQHIGNAPFQMEVNRYDNRVLLKGLA